MRTRRPVSFEHREGSERGAKLTSLSEVAVLGVGLDDRISSTLDEVPKNVPNPRVLDRLKAADDPLTVEVALLRLAERFTPLQVAYGELLGVSETEDRPSGRASFELSGWKIGWLLIALYISYERPVRQSREILESRAIDIEPP